MKHSVLFLIDVLGELGGAETNLAQVASLLPKDKYSPVICCLKGGKVFDELKAKKMNVIDLRVKRIYGISGIIKAFKLARIIKQQNIKIMVTYLESSDFWGSVVGRLAGVPIIVSSRRDMGFNLKLRHRLAYRIVNHSFDKIIAVCEGLREKIIRSEKVRPEKVLTIYNGVDIHEENGIDKMGLKKSLGLDSDKLTVTMLANLSPVKGHRDLLSAAVKVLEKIKSVQFLLVGAEKNGYKELLSEMASRLGIDKQIVFAGFRRDIPQILSISDISVLSSTSEGLSNAILEYMSSGKPVVATDVGGNKELVVNGSTGLLVPARNPEALSQAICTLLYDEKLRRNMGENGRNRVKAYFSKDGMIKNLEQLFDSLLGAKNIKGA